MAIRTKLAIWYSILVVIILTFIAGIRYSTYKRILQDQKDYSLKVIADVLDSSIHRSLPSMSDVQKAVARMIKEYPDIELKGTIIEVYNPSRSVIFLSSLSKTERLPITETMWQKALRREISLITMGVNDNTLPMRILTKPIFNKSNLVYLIQVGRSTQDIEAILGHFLTLNVIFIPIAALLLGLGGWLLTRHALRPLDDVINASRHISSGDFRHRIETSDTSSEIMTLASAFNQMIARLDVSFRQIQEFSENVSHELRIPLSILKGQTELSLRRFRSNDEYKKVLESNHEEIVRMENIVERLLFLSRADRGEIEINRVEIDLCNLMKYIYEQFQMQAMGKKIHLSLMLPLSNNISSSAGLQSDSYRHHTAEPFNADCQTIIKGDEVLLRELLLNLVQNAINYTGEGGEIRLSLEQQDGHAAISIADTGYGIPEDEIPHIFERFYQVDKSRSSHGNGLGLSICKWIVEAHQGRITVNSTIGKGSRFDVFLP